MAKWADRRNAGGLDDIDFIESFWRAGVASGEQVYDFDAEQLIMGIEVEMEHTTDRRIARKIAIDHLVEFPDYYTALAEMEAKLKEVHGHKPHWWVENDYGVVVDVGPAGEMKALARAYGGVGAGFHLMTAPGQLSKPIVGQEWGG